MVQLVVAQEEARVDGLGQQGVDGDHDQQHGQLQDRVKSEENCTGHHGQHAREDEVLETENAGGQTCRESGGFTLPFMDASRPPYREVSAILKPNRSQSEHTTASARSSV